MYKAVIIKSIIAYSITVSSGAFADIGLLKMQLTDGNERKRSEGNGFFIRPASASAFPDKVFAIPEAKTARRRPFRNPRALQSIRLC
jgi:hypothetical protein